MSLSLRVAMGQSQEINKPFVPERTESACICICTCICIVYLHMYTCSIQHLSSHLWVKYYHYCSSRRMALVLDNLHWLICHQTKKLDETRTNSHTHTYIYIYIYTCQIWGTVITHGSQLKVQETMSWSYAEVSSSMYLLNPSTPGSIFKWSKAGLNPEFSFS